MNGAMNMIRRFLAGLFMALVFPVVASAASPVTQYRITGTGITTAWFSTVSEAGAEWASLRNANTGTGCPGYQRQENFAFSHASGNDQYATFTFDAVSFSNSSCNTVTGTTSGTTQFPVTTRSWCPGTDTAPVNGQCEDTCTVGASKVLTFGVGWSATGEDDPNEGTWGIPPLSWCDGSCMFSFHDLIGVYMDEEVSANGYYEITATSEYQGTGATCTTPSDPPENPDPEPPCGDGNCTPGDGDGDGPGDGDGGGDPGDGDGDGDDGDTPGGENPGDGAGGDGDGDGEDPGDDGPGGGTGPGGDGEGEDEGGGECGIPGKPPCAVKIDETGVPDGNSIFNGVNTQVDNLPNHASFKDAIEGIKNNNDLTPSWTWTFQLPTGCTPFQLGGYDISIDVCQWQGMIHDIMSMIWAAATVWFLIALFMRAGD